MLLIIKFCPELNVYEVAAGLRSRVVTPAEFAPGGRLENLAPVFEKARAAVVDGRAISGISVEI